MNIFEYKELCAERVGELEKELVMAKARVMAIDEIIALNVSIPNVSESEDCEKEQSEVAEEQDFASQETDNSY